MAVHVLDDYYLAITLLITIAYQLIAFSIAFTLKFDKITDFAGGTNFILIAVLTLAFSSGGTSDPRYPSHTTPDARQIVVSLFLIAWAARLSGFLLFRILKTGKDDRFDDKRDKFFPFLGFFVFQMIWCWTTSLPVTIFNSPNVTRFPQPKFGQGRDIAGVILFVIGLGMESVSDVQKYLFKVHNKDKSAVCDVGFFGYSRHPNYFGEIVIQFAIFMIAVTPAAHHTVRGGAYSALYASILGAFFLTTLLLFVSGLPLQERPGAKKRYESGNNWEGYKNWLDRTSILIPLPPAVWTRLPVWVKRTVGMEWPMYVFVPERDADQGKVREREQEEGRGGLVDGASGSGGGSRSTAGGTDEGDAAATSSGAGDNGSRDGNGNGNTPVRGYYSGHHSGGHCGDHGDHGGDRGSHSGDGGGGGGGGGF